MGSLNSESMKQSATDAAPAGNIAADDLVEIVFNEDSKIEGRKPGVVYQVDKALAHHYCQFTKVAAYKNAKDAPEPEPPPTNDRSMEPPPRGGRKGK